MSNLVYYFLLILLAIYILSPLDAHPLFLDDLIATGVLFYLLYKISKQKKQRQRYYSYSHGKSQSYSKYRQNTGAESQKPVTLDEACVLLGVDPNASWEEINKAYKEKISKSHPDKVSHLSEELQEKARELTLKLNQALDIIKRSRSR